MEDKDDGCNSARFSSGGKAVFVEHLLFAQSQAGLVPLTANLPNPFQEDSRLNYTSTKTLADQHLTLCDLTVRLHLNAGSVEG